MLALLRRLITIKLGIIGLSILLVQCAWIKGGPSEPEIIKPIPIDGYEVLSGRIHYPRSIREQGTEGTVTVNAFISREGSVSETRIVNKLDPELDQIAANAIKRTLFKPALSDGSPVDVWISIPIVFALKDWQVQSTPFSIFEMILQPSPSYQSFEVKMQADLKPHLKLPMRFELLLPINAENTWAKTGEKMLKTATVRDENGEWLIFQLDDRYCEMGFKYHPFGDQGGSKFQYKIALNYPLPNWEMAVVYEGQQLQFSQEPNRITEQEDGSWRYSYDLGKLEAYEALYLELDLVK